jgi:hypothetical protein
MPAPLDLEINMGSIVVFVPYLVFCFVERAGGGAPALMAAAATAAAFFAQSLWGKDQAINRFDISSAVLFMALSIILLKLSPNWSPTAIGISVDIGLLVLTLSSVVFENPFAADYLRGRVAPYIWRRPEFDALVYLVTMTWASAFAVLLTADLFSSRFGSYVLVFNFGIKLGAIGVAVHSADREKAGFQAKQSIQHEPKNGQAGNLARFRGFSFLRHRRQNAGC